MASLCVPSSCLHLTINPTFASEMAMTSLDILISNIVRVTSSISKTLTLSRCKGQTTRRRTGIASGGIVIPSLSCSKCHPYSGKDESQPSSCCVFVVRKHQWRVVFNHIIQNGMHSHATRVFMSKVLICYEEVLDNSHAWKKLIYSNPWLDVMYQEKRPDSPWKEIRYVRTSKCGQKGTLAFWSISSTRGYIKKGFFNCKSTSNKRTNSTEPFWKEKQDWAHVHNLAVKVWYEKIQSFVNEENTREKNKHCPQLWSDWRLPL